MGTFENKQENNLSIRIIFVYLHIENYRYSALRRAPQISKNKLVTLQSNSCQRPAWGNTDSFDATNLSSGTYIIRVNYKETYGKEVVYLKLIKE